MITNLKQLMRDFDTEEKCRAFLVRQRWDGCPKCPYCGSEKWYIIENGKRFKCGNSDCYKKYSVTVGTVFHASNIPLTTWFPAMYIISAHKKGISSIQLAKDLGVTQKTAWFMLHRIRESLKDKGSDLLTGVVEVDETYMSRKYGSKYSGLTEEQAAKLPLKKNKKGAVIGMIQRDGKAIIKAADSISKQNIIDAVQANIAPDATLMTDESNLYKNREIRRYKREYVTHTKKQWVDGNCHVNTVESFWGMMKRGIYGIYHQVSFKHLQAYCDEFAYRRNTKQLKDGERFELCLSRIEGRLDYVTLTKKNKDGKSS